MSAPSKSSSCNSDSCGCQSPLTRRDFIRWTSLAAAGVAGVPWPSIAGPFNAEEFAKMIPADKKLDPAWVKSLFERGEPTVYRGAELEKIGMPIGGICAGQLYLGGDGRLWHWDIFNLHQASNFTSSDGPNYARPPKPASPIEQGFALKLTAAGQTRIRTLDSRGFDPRHTAFRGQYPMAFVDYRDPALPVTVSLEAFSPFIPLNVADSSLPATVMRFTVKNTSASPVEVELAGWLENAVCLGSSRAGPGQRRNRVLRETGLTLVYGTAESVPAPEPTAPRPEIVFETFENGYGSWKLDGEAFGTEPAKGTLPGQHAVSGFLGKQLVNTFLKGDATQGRLTSPSFKIERRFIAFLIGGGSDAGRTCLNLLLDGRAVRTAAGQDVERLVWSEWDVSEFEGRTARLEIVDQATEGWGHINVDQIVFTDEPPAARTPLETQEDFGSMGLAVLGDDAKAFARAGTAVEPIEALFANTPAAESEAVLPFGRKLIGAVGRKLTLAAGEQGEATLVVVWHFPGLMRRALGRLQDVAKLRRAYAKRFKSAADAARYVAREFDRLAGQTRLWNQTWYDSTLPYWFLDRTFAPICTLATNTCYQFDTGRFYAFEGVYCCQGTCQHVWNYAQSVARVFPELERDLRQRTDFGSAWHEDGATDYRGECDRRVAHDGQCGVILRAWREHQMSPDDRYLIAAWPRIRKSIEYLIALDGDENGILEGKQYNTLDAAWFGPMAWISSLYVAALRAGEAMALEVGDSTFAEHCRRIAERGSEQIVQQLYNGEFFIHKPDPKYPKATNTNDGCHIDQLMGQAWAMQVGLPRVVAAKETRSALEAIWKYNFTPDVGPYRDQSSIKGGRWYAMAGEGGVVMTTFPRGGAGQATGQGGFAHYFNEVWTGQEHQLAAHMICEGMVEKAFVITRILHDRHHAARRNPYNEIECSDHYARAMSSHGSFIAVCGYEHNGPKGHLGFAPRLTPERFKAPFTTAEGWGSFSQARGSATQLETIVVRYGRLRLKTLAFTVPESQPPRSVQVRLDSRPVKASLQTSGSVVLVTFVQETIVKSGETLEVTLA
jgi:non-lysosomal glucosylceramidase